MKTIILTALLLITASACSQSVLTLGTGTSMGVLTGTNLCADILNGSGILYGSGNVCGGLVAVEPPVSNEMPLDFNLLQNYPNPFNPVTMLKYQVPQESYVTIKLYDELGREAGVLYDGNQHAGYYQFTVDGTNLASGLYYCRIEAGNFTKVIKMSLIK